MSNRCGIELEVQWTRLIAIVDEVGAALRRTAFSTVTREANDFACVLLDRWGNSLAQSTESVPSFIGTLPITAKQIIRRYSLDGFRPGDVVVTNDPWLGTGHLPDVTMVTPIFCDGRLVAFAGSVIHLADIGGGRLAAEAFQIYEEGLRIPIVKFWAAGRLNETLVELIRANVRVPDQVLGDLQSQAAANELAARRFIEFIHDHSLDDLAAVATAIQSRSEEAMRREIARLADGRYTHVVRGDGYNEPIEIRITIIIAGSDIVVDYAGTSPQSERGINSVPNYTFASTVFALKCVLDPETPNNEGCFRPIAVKAPEGSILNPRFPAAVNARHVPGHLLQAAVFGALAKILPERIQADSGLGWPIGVAGEDAFGNSFSTQINFNGGQGARYHKDGTSTLSFPSNAWNTPLEIVETLAPLVFEEKVLITDSGGAGRRRGGCGQRVAVRCTTTAKPVIVSIMADRFANPPLGTLGGGPGRRGAIRSNRAGRINPKGRIHLHHGDRLVFELPGGGGVGNPHDRERELVLRDVHRGFVSPQQARDVYGVAVEVGADERLRKG